MATPLDLSSLSWVVFFPLLTALALLAQRIIAASIFNSKGLPAFAWRAIALLGSGDRYLEAAYREMAQDEIGETEALEWAEATIGDVSVEPR